MARLHEYQGKQLLEAAKILIPPGGPARTPAEAAKIAAECDGPVVIKGQIWVTGRAGLGFIRFADSPKEAEEAAGLILGASHRGFTVDTVLVESRLEIEREFYTGVIIDDGHQAPVLIFSSIGGTGIEEIAKEHPEAIAQTPVNVVHGFYDYQARDLIRQTGIHGKLLLQLGSILPRLVELARANDARAAEINPLVLTTAGQLVAADCRITVDDYATYRHPELGIEVAREYDRPPTSLERIAWEVEKNDYRGTFYFIQMLEHFKRGEHVIGFHGAGGGGSMMSMDAVLNRGYKLANFVDTSGNPPASKVYRAARIILAQGPIDGYFASGSGVASQEQFHSARGLVKAFMEVPLCVPAVIRLGGNEQEQAIRILKRSQPDIPAPVEAYGKDDSPAFCAERLDHLIQEYNQPDTPPKGFKRPIARDPYTFETVTGGRVEFDHALCRECESKICSERCVPGILKLEDGVPILAISNEQALKGGCTECLACQIECYYEGNKGGHIELPIPKLDGYTQIVGMKE
jgi:succinyl-CoA synthetase beta subunit